MAGGRLTLPLADPAIGANGEIAPGSTLTVYDTGTTTLAAMYADSAMSVPVANPQNGVNAANSAGRFYTQSTSFFLDDTAAYDVVLGFPDGSFVTYDAVNVVAGVSNISGYAPLNSPVFTGTPTAPTPATNDDSAKLATTAYVQAQNYAPLASPSFSGTPTAPTPAGGDDSTTLATTAFVKLIANGTFTDIGNMYLQLSNGFIMQAGLVITSVTPGNITLTFPTPFPTACLFVLPIIANTTGATSTVTGVAIRSVPTTSNVSLQFNGFQSGSYNAVAGFYWFAFGY